MRWRRNKDDPSPELEKARRETQLAREKHQRVDDRTSEIEAISYELAEYRRLNHFTPAIELSMYRQRRHA